MSGKGLAHRRDITPITIGCYTLHETGIDVAGRPTLGEHQGVGDFIGRAHKASGWWVADWLKYGESREDWAERVQQVVEATHYSAASAKNLKLLGESVAPSRRREDVHISLHFVVAALPAKEQTMWLEKAATGGWTVRELRQAIDASRRETVLDARADTMHTVDVTVQVEVEAGNETRAQDRAWEDVKKALHDAGLGKAARVISARARPR